ncbi:MAG: hypothetical protein JW882_15265 [Deltaproteobacteria bacterium]|nr:hypothetical protein [Deltaproteobacteria bacterium]
MRQFYIIYAGHKKLQPLVGEISWSKHIMKSGTVNIQITCETKGNVYLELIMQ